MPETRSKRHPSYGDFSLDKVRKQFQLEISRTTMFEQITPLQPSQWLSEVLAKGFAVSVVSEKARSEFIVAPILVYLRDVHHDRFSIYSGVKFDVDATQGLRGICDFIVSQGPMLLTVQAPTLIMVEAKKNDIEDGIGQCVAEMVAGQIFNRREGKEIGTIYGCVTTGESWQFLRLTGTQLEIDSDRYFLVNLPDILGILDLIVCETIPSA